MPKNALGNLTLDDRAMTRRFHDQFAKGYLHDLLAQSGVVQSGYALSSEVKEIDLYFKPNSAAIESLQGLGLLGRLASTFCLIEPYRNAVQVRVVQACVSKVLEVCLQQYRDAKRDRVSPRQVLLPCLWIMTPMASHVLIESFRAQQQEQWGEGIYFLPEPLHTTIVVLHQLPTTLDTLWLRLMGRGAVQAQAIAELMALSTSDAFRLVTLQHLAKLQLTMKIRQNRISKREQELIDNFSPVYELWERETLEKGRQEGKQLMLARTVPVLLNAGMSIDQIAEQLQVDTEAVRQAAETVQNR